MSAESDRRDRRLADAPGQGGARRAGGLPLGGGLRRSSRRASARRAADWVADALRAEGFQDVPLLDTPDGTQSVYGYLPGPAGAPTVLLYAHYDVQPPLDEAAWTTPPFELTERDGRWYGRGAADCKGGVHHAPARAARAQGATAASRSTSR